MNYTDKYIKDLLNKVNDKAIETEERYHPVAHTVYERSGVIRNAQPISVAEFRARYGKLLDKKVMYLERILKPEYLQESLLRYKNLLRNTLESIGTKQALLRLESIKSLSDDEFLENYYEGVYDDIIDEYEADRYADSISKLEGLNTNQFEDLL